jgi:hypothetical protein
MQAAGCLNGMNNLRTKIQSLKIPFWAEALFLLALAVAAYGLMAPWLGYYWDDAPLIWIYDRLGPAGVARYFSTNRPYWGQIFQFSFSLLGDTPWHWQAYAIFWRWTSSVALLAALQQVWPNVRKAVLWVATLVLIYPGFDQQNIAIFYSHFFLVLTCLFFSFYCNILALRRPRWAIWLSALAILASAVNLITLEYFFLLELLRPLLIWAAQNNQQRETGERLSIKRQLLEVTRTWAPYLALLIGVVIWRLFFFSFQTHNYQPTLLQQLKTTPIATLGALAVKIAHDVWLVGFSAWGLIVNIWPVKELGTTNFVRMVVVMTGSAVLALAFFLGERKEKKENRAEAWQMFAIGWVGLLIAGWPFWLTALPISLSFPGSRFTLPFILGSALVIIAVFKLLPLPSWPKAAVLAVVVGLAIGQHYQTSILYRQDWSWQRNLVWQMSWRMPQVKPGTTFLASELAFKHYSDNSLTGLLNYALAPENTSQDMSVMFFYPSIRLGNSLPAFKKGLPIQVNYLAATFTGSTSQTVALYYNPPSCVRILDPQIEQKNMMVSPLIREASQFSTTDPIIPGEQVSQPPSAIEGSEPAHGWCYYFEKADLARQQGDWQQVASLGDEAFALNDYPNDPVERMVFVEGYAHVGQWQRAVEISNQSREITPLMEPVICSLWSRIRANTPSSSNQQQSIAQATAGLSCPAQ